MHNCTHTHTVCGSAIYLKCTICCVALPSRSGQEGREEAVVCGGDREGGEGEGVRSTAEG